jgi:outer membrane translocation and assembly module TamA
MSSRPWAARADGKPFGGLSLAETSLELRRAASREHGEVGWAGSSSGRGPVGLEETPSFDELKAAVGVGVRYDLGFGPIRADLPIPVEQGGGRRRLPDLPQHRPGVLTDAPAPQEARRERRQNG